MIEFKEGQLVYEDDFKPVVQIEQQVQAVTNKELEIGTDVYITGVSNEGYITVSKKKLNTI